MNWAHVHLALNHVPVIVVPVSLEHSVQMPAFVYRWYFRPHLENTLRLSGIRHIRETLIGRVESPDRSKRAWWLRKMHALGREAR